MSDELCCGYSDKGHMKWCDEGHARHPKWQRVEPGTVIPAGQPIRWELANGDAYESVPEYGRTVTPDMAPHFIDSSWKPPLVLPTEPTWGIAVHPSHGPRFGRWCLNKTRTTLEDSGPRTAWQGVSATTAFIPVPLTDEQVVRIEAAR